MNEIRTCNIRLVDLAVLMSMQFTIINTNTGTGGLVLAI